MEEPEDDRFVFSENDDNPIVTDEKCEISSEHSIEVKTVDEIFDVFLSEKTLSNPTRKIKICHYDFTYIKVDVLISLLKCHIDNNKCGKILSIIKYPTETGMKNNDNDVYFKLLDEIDDEDQTEQLNMEYYENTLEFYEIVIEFDSVDCAKSVMESLDGIQIELTGRRLDLYYIDENEEFNIPEKYMGMVENFSAQLKLPQKYKPTKELPNPRIECSWQFDFRSGVSDCEENDISETDRSESEMSLSETENESEADTRVIKFKRYRKKHFDVKEMRRLVGCNDSSSEDSNGDDVSENGDSDVDISDNEAEEIDDCNNESKTNKKISRKEKMKMFIKEKKQKKQELEKEYEALIEEFIDCPLAIVAYNTNCYYQQYSDNFEYVWFTEKFLEARRNYLGNRKEGMEINEVQESTEKKEINDCTNLKSEDNQKDCLDPVNHKDTETISTNETEDNQKKGSINKKKSRKNKNKSKENVEISMETKGQKENQKVQDRKNVNMEIKEKKKDKMKVEEQTNITKTKKRKLKVEESSEHIKRKRMNM